MEDFLALAVRISVMYVFVLTMLRISGKRSVDTATPLDFLIGLVLGDMFDDIFWSEVPMAQSLVAVTTLLFCHVLVAYLSYRSTFIHRLVSSKETLLVHLARFNQEGMDKERMDKDSIYSELRLQNEENLKELRDAFLEPGGKVSALKKEEFKPLQKQDLAKLKEPLA